MLYPDRCYAIASHLSVSMAVRFKYMRKYILIIGVLLFTGCINMNINKQPDKWVTVLFADTGKPASGVPLVYMSVRKPYFIVGTVMISREYVSDINGKAYVPSGVILKAAPESNYVVVTAPVNDLKNIDSKKDTTIYVITDEQYMQELQEENRTTR